jgi:hypothetical protein
MPETIETFVAKLRQEAIEAGRAQAEQHLAKARQEAEAVVTDAHARAARIVEDAQAQAQTTLARSRTDLELAARDVALRLREALSRAVRGVLAAGARRPLTDHDFLCGLIHDVVMQYVRASSEGQTAIEINVSPEVRDKLAQWVLAHLHQKADMAGASIDLKGTLAEAGFEYRADGASVEITLSSVVDALADLVGPSLRDILQQAMAEKK